MEHASETERGGIARRLLRAIIGAPRHLKDPQLFHKMALIPVLAWVGLGADGLSSSAYGPEEAFRALGEHSYLALALALATALTVFIISYAYSRIIEHFPHGGGGYIVATHILGEKAGVVSGSALLVDYVMTITISIASCCDALFSYLPQTLHHHKVAVACILTIALIILNMRGVKESITVLAPIFMLFVLTHLVMLLYGITTHADRIVPVVAAAGDGLRHDLSTIGAFGILLLFLRAYSLGGGTYTGIEAVSNGMQIMREPRVQTGKRTMVYMATSLAFTAGVLLLCYLLVGITPVQGKTLNSVLADTLFAGWPLGSTLACVTIVSEGALLLVAAQAGFVDGPRVMSNMAIDSWFPHRFAALSVRLTMRNGILLMGMAAIALLFYTRGSVSTLVVMYSINVFVTFSLSQLGMSKFFIQRRKEDPQWVRHLSVHLVGAAAVRHDPGRDDLREIRRGGLDHPADHGGGDRPLLPDQGALPARAAGDEGPGRDPAGCAAGRSRRAAPHRPQRPHRHPAGLRLQRLRRAHPPLDPLHLPRDLSQRDLRLRGPDRFRLLQGGRGGGGPGGLGAGRAGEVRGHGT